MKNKNLIIGIAIALAVGAGGFFGGMQYQKSKTPSFGGEGDNFRSGQFSQGGDHQPGQDDGFRGRFSGSGRPVSGEVISKDDESITVKDQEGGSKIIFISSETVVRKTDEGSLDDLAEGTQVLVFGSENDDGSVTAENIQLNPEFGTDRFNRGGQEEN
ncbi:MAG: hypothetical protein ACC618_03260 [Patescibacteria group bacterium]